VPTVHLVNALYQQRPEPPRTELVAMAQPAAQAAQTSEPSTDKSFVGGIAALGYKDLSVDQLISL
jgi:hypothetical protein